jgi:glycosyltransferase involved in cell wall biosynthesis
MHTVVYDHQTFSLQQFGGISRYFCELASRVHCTDDFEARVIAPLHFNSYLPACPVPQSALSLPLRFRGHGRVCRATNAMLSPLLTWASSPSLIHRTYYSPPLRRSRIPVVLTVFDMIHELFPDHFPATDPVIRNKPASVAAADHVICISKSTANDLVRLFGVPSEKVSVIYLACSDVFARPAPSGEKPPRDRPYILYVGDRKGYKNFGTALRAYASSRQLTTEFDLITFGGPAFNAEEQAMIDSLGLRPGSVVRIGGSDADLARAYRHARAFIYPSQYEGFGIPPLEAMNSGCVVACSNTSSLPEVVGDAALTFDPNDGDAVRRALEESCFNEGTRMQLLKRSAVRVREFTWERCAHETVAAYRQAIPA